MDLESRVAFQQRMASRKEKEAARAKKLEEARAKEAKLRDALIATNKPKPVSSEFQELVEVCPKMGQHLRPVMPAYYAARPTEQSTYAKGVADLLKLEPFRKLSEWKPQGKSAEALFRSLGGHLLAKYPVPPFLWSGFFGDSNRRLFIPLIQHVARGGSLVEYIKTQNFPVKLTRKLCHEFLKSPSDLSVVPALRRVQIRDLGGDGRLLAAILATPLGTALGANQEEEFNQGMFAWFAKQPMLDPQQIAPMIDYIRFCRNQDLAYSLKGRTALTVMRGMEAWHAETARAGVRGYKGAAVFKPSGFPSAEYDFSRGDDHVEIWRIAEILTAKDLAAEGKRQNHCVFSYTRQIEQGTCSIWTLTKEDNKSRAEHGGIWHMLTLEVRNDLRSVVQARGRFNRPATAHELNIIQRWMSAGAGVQTRNA